MNKHRIQEQLKRQDYLMGLNPVDVDAFGLLFERLRERDYDGFVQVAFQNGINLGPVFKALEKKAAEYLRSGNLLRCYELSVLESFFTDQEDKTQADNGEVIDTLEKNRVRELYFLISSTRFSEKQVTRFKYYLEEWGLDSFKSYLWQRGLNKHFNERYSKCSSIPEGEYTIKEIIAKVELAAILEGEKLIEDYIFDETGRSKRQDGLKEDLLKEQQGREKAHAILEKLYASFQEDPLDYNLLKKLMLDLHMERQVELINNKGIYSLREQLQKDWFKGAKDVAQRFGFTVPQVLDPQDTLNSVPAVNTSFLNQSEQSEKGRVFLRQEAILAITNLPQNASCHRLASGYLLLSYSPFEEEEHYIFGQFLTIREQTNFLIHFFENYFLSASIKQTAVELIRYYLDSLSGQIRLKNAIKIAIFAFPVMILVSLLVGWLYNYTLENANEAVMIGAAIMLLGEAIAARNGYSQKIKPENQEQIPGYAVREKGILKTNPIGGDREG